MFALKGHDFAEVVETQEGRFPAVPGKVDLRTWRSFDVLDDVLLQDGVGHAKRLSRWIKEFFLQVVTIVTAQIADGPNGLGENLKFAGGFAHGSAPDLSVEGHKDIRELSHA